MTPLSDSEARTVARFESAEPAPESWGGGLRSAVAEAIWVNMPDEPYRQDADIAADAVLALPELAALRAKADAADRVRELAEEHRRWAVINRDLADRVDGSDVDFHIGMAQAQESTVRHLYAALDGEPPC